MRLCPCGRGWVPVPTDPPGEQRCPTCRFGMSLSLLVGGKPRPAAQPEEKSRG